jgi:hypothetical protein
VEKTMPSHPLSHHEILTLAEPFARQGRHLDLAATNRLECSLVFKPVERNLEAANAKLTEVLQLESREENFRLTGSKPRRHSPVWAKTCLELIAILRAASAFLTTAPKVIAGTNDASCFDDRP